jgi:hypothetical protein
LSVADHHRDVLGPTEEAEDPDQRERGAVLVLGAAVLLVLMGMAAFAIDLGWYYFNQVQTQKAAEAAALAGVVHMPKPSFIPFNASEAYTVALDVASRQGYKNDGITTVTPLPVVNGDNRLRVEIDTSVNTFFMRLFGRDTLPITKGATAEQLPPLKLGSDESSLGGSDRDFWVSVNGEREAKQNGDPYSTRCIAANCGGTDNLEYLNGRPNGSPAYYYAVEVPDSEIGKLLQVQIYDGPHNPNTGKTASDAGDPDATGDRGSNPIDLEFRLKFPDQTPNDPTTPPSAIPGCTRVFNFTADDTDPELQAWSNVCSAALPAVSGIYVLEVYVGGGAPNISDFAIRATTNGNPVNAVAVYGIGAMSLDMVVDASAPNFKIVKLEEFYKGNDLILSVFDPGDVTGDADLTFLGELATIDCEVRITRDDGSVEGWKADDSPGSPPCFLKTSAPANPKIYNGDWVEFRFKVPDGYVCASDCWVLVNYDLADPSERTTWTARVDGQPIHLLP